MKKYIIICCCLGVLLSVIYFICCYSREDVSTPSVVSDIVIPKGYKPNYVYFTGSALPLYNVHIGNGFFLQSGRRVVNSNCKKFNPNILMQEILLEVGEYILFSDRTKITRKSVDRFEIEWEKVRWEHTERKSKQIVVNENKPYAYRILPVQGELEEEYLYEDEKESYKMDSVYEKPENSPDSYEGIRDWINFKQKRLYMKDSDVEFILVYPAYYNLFQDKLRG